MPKKKSIQAILHSPRIPSLPAVAIRVLELTRDENVNFREVADLIQNDQALALKIIRTVNSSYFGLARPCTSINQAIVLLGLNTVKTLVLGFSLVDSIDGSSDHDVGFDYAQYWHRSLHSAVAAREIARLTDACDPEEAFLAALIQDVGMVALYRAFGDVYIQVLDLTQADHSRLIVRERKSLEMDHAEVGTAIGEMWRLPEQLVCAIQHHHDSQTCTGRFAGLARIIELAGYIAAHLKDARETASLPDQLATLVSEWTDLDQSQVELLLETVRSGASELASLFKVDINSPITIDQVLSEAEDLRLERTVLQCHATANRAQSVAVKTATCAEPAADTDRGAPPETAAETSKGRCGASIVSPPTFRQQLRAAMVTAEARNGCVAALVCEMNASGAMQITSADFAMPLTEQIAEEVGVECVISQSGSERVMLFIPRADRITAARLAHTIRQRIPSSGASPTAQNPDNDRLTLNIGAASYEETSRSIIADEQKLLALAEQALEVAVSAGPGAVRVFNPVSSTGRAA